MLSELMNRVRNMFKPYTFEDYVREANPQTWSELKELERNWHKHTSDFKSSY
jgi:hypothetical protein